MKPTVHTLSVAMLILVVIFSAFPIGRAQSIHTLSLTRAVSAPLARNPQQPLLADEPMIEEAPQGYYFPYEDGTGSTPGEPLPDPGTLLSQLPSQYQRDHNSIPAYVKASLRSQTNTFDLGVWLLSAYDILDSINDPTSLHQIGQRVLAFQRGPLVDDLGLKFLEKAFTQDQDLVWTANNYAVQKYLTEGISPTTHGLFEEANNRASNSGQESYATQNLRLYQTAVDKMQTRISLALSKYSSGYLDSESHLALVHDLIWSNYLDQAELHLASLPSGSQLITSRQILVGLLLKRKKDFKAAAAAFRVASGALKSKATTQADSISLLGEGRRRP